MDSNNLLIVLNDMLTPNFVKEIPVPSMPTPPISVEEFYGGGFNLDNPEGKAAHCFGVAAAGINLATAYNGGNFAWAGTKTLKIRPEAGVFFNAYYDRLSLRFYHNFDEIRRREMYCSWSMDIVAHELGHAILDALRPDLYNFAVFEIMAMHECFGDFFAICLQLQYDEVMDNLHKQTGGDLRKPNSVAKLAEEFATAFFKTPLDKTDYLRNALNSFEYVSPSSLPPSSGDPHALSDDPHSFSQVMTGALYEILMLIFESMYEESKHNYRKLCFKQAVDVMLKYIFGAIKVAPANPLFLSSFAVGMVYTDITSNNSKYRSILEQVFITKRKIIQVPAQPVKLSGVKALSSTMTSDGPVYTASRKQREFLNIAEETGNNSNPLYKFSVETPFDAHYSMKSNGSALTFSQSPRSEGIKSVKTSLNYLHRKNLVGTEEHQTFNVVNGKISRKQFSCFSRS